MSEERGIYVLQKRGQNEQTIVDLDALPETDLPANMQPELLPRFDRPTDENGIATGEQVISGPPPLRVGTGTDGLEAGLLYYSTAPSRYDRDTEVANFLMAMVVAKLTGQPLDLTNYYAPIDELPS